MENAAQVLRLFDLKYKSVTRERAYHLCSTDKGLKALKKAPDADAVMAAHAVKTRLADDGVFTNGYRAASGGLPYAVYGADIFTVSDYIPHNPADFTDPDQLRLIIQTAAKIHTCCRNMALPNRYAAAAKTRLNSFSPLVIHDRNKRLLTDYKKTILKKSRVSDFDMVLLNNYGRFIETLDKWHETMRSGCFLTLENTAVTKNYICHNLLKEENILVGGGDIYVTGFGEITVAHNMNDLQSLVKRYVKSRPQTVIPLPELIGVYDGINPVSDEELVYLKALLLFPDKFLDICHDYYCKKRTFTPRTFETRMDALIENHDFYEKYISAL